MKNQLLQMHTIKSFPPSSVNRGKDGLTKWCDFGGYRRSRISSQSIKYAIRNNLEFKEALGDFLAERTISLPRLVGRHMKDMGCSEEQVKFAVEACLEFGKAGKEAPDGEGADENLSKNMTRQVVVFTDSELSNIADGLLSYHSSGGDTSARGIRAASSKLSPLYGSGTDSADIALFGRMSTAPALNTVRAAAEFSHAISVNSCPDLVDWFITSDTAVSSAGQSFVGESSYATPIHYHYLNVDNGLLADNLSDSTPIAKDALLSMIRSALMSEPSGKSNTMASRTLPSHALLELSERKVPLSYANAFLIPTDRSMPDDFGRDMATFARDTMIEHSNYMENVYNIKRDHKIIFPSEQTPTIDALMEQVSDALD